jgi:hypothetical protein
MCKVSHPVRCAPYAQQSGIFVGKIQKKPLLFRFRIVLIREKDFSIF